MAWKKGESGNPAGRKTEDNPVKKLARKHSPAAIKKLVELAQSDDGNIAVKACNSILDRAYGKPAQAIEADVAVRTVIENWRERTQDSATE